MTVEVQQGKGQGYIIQPGTSDWKSIKSILLNLKVVVVNNAKDTG